MAEASEKIEIIQGDITRLEADAIVNAANTTLLGGGGVDGPIHRAAGPRLLVECRRLGGCPTGKAKATGGYRLPARYVFHTVGPVWQEGAHQEDDLLASCYRECMKLAQAHRVKTIAFPAISCGVYHFPVERAARIAISTLLDCLKDMPGMEKIHLVCFDPQIYQTYRKVLRELTHHADD